jgi:hypothetical protein
MYLISRVHLGMIVGIMIVGIIFHEGTSSELHTESGKSGDFSKKDTFVG